MAFRWAVARCESMKPRNARLDPVPPEAVVVAEAVGADTVGVAVAAIAEAVATAEAVAAIVVAAAHAAGKFLGLEA
jgi:hypothetical protein